MITFEEKQYIKWKMMDFCDSITLTMSSSESSRIGAVIGYISDLVEDDRCDVKEMISGLKYANKLANEIH